jgi:hypothetical protein
MRVVACIHPHPNPLPPAGEGASALSSTDEHASTRLACQPRRRGAGRAGGLDHVAPATRAAGCRRHRARWAAMASCCRRCIGMVRWASGVRHEARHRRLPDEPVPTRGDLLRAPRRAEPAVLHPLEMQGAHRIRRDGGSLAYNEVSLLRQTRQAAHVSIELNGDVRLDELICDGVMVATPAGSTAYNFSAQWPDPAPRQRRDRADADRAVPPASLARRGAQGRHRSAIPRARSLQTPGQRHRRFARSPRRHRSGDPRISASAASRCCSTPSTISKSGS